MHKIIPVVSAGVTALALAGGTFAYAAETKDVTLAVDGAAREVTGRSDTVGEVLQAEGITVGQHDVVAPAVDAPVSDGSRVTVQYGRPVTATVDGRSRTVWTTATRVDQALAALKVDTSGAALSTSGRSVVGRQGTTVAVVTRKTVTLDAAGRRSRVQTTGRTVADVLRANKISVDANDRLNVAANRPITDGASIVYTRVDVATVTKRKSVPAATVYDRTSRLPKGVRRVATSGTAGTKTLTYREIRHDGKVVSRRQTGSEVTTQPQDKVVRVGTKEAASKPEPRPQVDRSPDRDRDRERKADRTPEREHEHKSERKADRERDRDRDREHKSARAADREADRKAERKADRKAERREAKASSSRGASGGGVWNRIARCESGGNWSINTGNGYYGGLQFSKSTWRAFGGSGMPHRASKSRQIAVAKKVQRSQGWGAWPGCTRKLGLR